MRTTLWLSSVVEKTWLFEVGTVVLRSMILVAIPPCVSTPSESGVTSSSSTSASSPVSTPPWIAAPAATTSSGFTLLFGGLPKISSTLRCTAGMRVMPPTRITSSISLAGEARVVERLLARLDQAVDQVGDQLLELGAREREPARCFGTRRRPPR